MLLRLPRFMPCLALACSLSVPLVVVNVTFAQGTPAAVGTPATSAPGAVMPPAHYWYSLMM